MSEEALPQIDLSGDGGAQKRLTHEGSGTETPGDGCRVVCHYTGTLVSTGAQFDSSVGREPFEFELGKESVVKGFELAAASMKKGERAVFTFAPEYAYGSYGSPPNIPGNSTLQFEMEMLDWKPQDVSPNQDGAITRHILTKSDHPKMTPADGVLVNGNQFGFVLAGVCKKIHKNKFQYLQSIWSVVWMAAFSTNAPTSS